MYRFTGKDTSHDMSLMYTSWHTLTGSRTEMGRGTFGRKHWTRSFYCYVFDHKILFSVWLWIASESHNVLNF